MGFCFPSLLGVSEVIWSHTALWGAICITVCKVSPLQGNNSNYVWKDEFKRLLTHPQISTWFFCHIRQFSFCTLKNNTRKALTTSSYLNAAWVLSLLLIFLVGYNSYANSYLSKLPIELELMKLMRCFGCRCGTWQPLSHADFGKRQTYRTSNQATVPTHTERELPEWDVDKRREGQSGGRAQGGRTAS